MVMQSRPGSWAQGDTEAARLDRWQTQRNLVRGVVELEAINWLAQEADRGGELSAVRLESDPGGAR